MRKILLLPFILCAVIYCKAQQKELDSLLNELKKHPQEDTIQLKLLNQISYDYETIKSQVGIIVANKAITSAKKQNQKKYLAVSYNRLAQNFQSIGNYDSALFYCNQSLMIAKELKDAKLIAIEYETIGMNYFYVDSYYKAIGFQKQALDIFIKLNKKNLQGDVLNSLGVDYEFLGDYPKALQYFQQAITIRESAGLNDVNADAFTNIGLIYNKLEEYDKALLNYGKALKINTENENKLGMADCYGNIATIYDEKGDTVKSRYFYRKNLQLAKEASYNYGILSSQVNLGISYSNNKNYDSALFYLNSAFINSKKSGDKTITSMALTYLSNCYLKATNQTLNKSGVSNTNKLTEALQMQLQSISIASQIKDPQELSDGFENLSEIYIAQKNYAKALDAYKQFIVNKDSILNDDKEQEITRLEMQYQFNKREDSIKTINDKQQIVAYAQIQKQHVIQNSTIAGAGFLLLAGISGFVFYKRNRDIRLKKNEAELKEQITDTEMKALRAQMNPHFIFNSLNSIADYIDKNQTQLASDFTVKFAKLMRMVLENSEQKEIPLSDDLKALELYIQLEQLRLKNKFSYEIIVDGNIDKETTLVPPLILQPFVENSIWHGFAKKEGIGNIKIYIKQEGEMINCIVEDDGGGIKETELINEEKRSLGMKITKARIDIINKLKNADASMNVSNKEKGVRAEVKLPLELSF